MREILPIGRRLLVAGLVAGLAAATLTGCSVSAKVEPMDGDEPAQSSEPAQPKPSEPETPKTPPPSASLPKGAKGGVMRLGLANLPLTLDPAQAVDHESLVVCENLFDTLVRYSADSTDIEPGLAESWDHTKDELTWVFQLRSGAKFHDGTPVTADAVAFSFHRMMDPGHPYRATESVFWKRLMHPVRSVRVLDSERLALELDRPYGPLLAALAMPQCAIVSPEAVKKLGNDFARSPVGSGPFKLVAWSAGQSITLTANATYWGDKPLLDGAVIRGVSDPAARLLRLARGDLDAMEGIASEDLAFAAKTGLKVEKAPGLNTVYLAFNTSGSDEPEEPTTASTSTPAGATSSPLRARARKGLASARIRKALARGIDKSAIASDVYGGLAVAATSPMPPGLWGHAEKSEEGGFDPAAARQLLEQAGYESNFSIELLTLDRPRSYLPQPRKLAHRVRKDLTSLGIDVRVRVLDFEAYQELVQDADYEACLMGWTADTGDPDNCFYTLLSADSIRPPDSTNLSFFTDPELQRVLLEGQGAADRASRERLYARAEKLTAARAPILPLAHLLETLVFRASRVSGLRLHPVGFRRLSTASLTP
ncbi:MAG: ABC transporter substrate-binding protein [Candidatus Wallbacteria bacterium]|nr:ABC transporter substrate-binding protein [Candidatus Wallbacteria bacterium]